MRDSLHRLAGLRLAAFVLLSAALAGACGGSAGTGGGQPVLDFSGPSALTVASASGQLNVGVRWSPSPPAVGLDASELTITDASGAPAAGLALTMLPWMPAHGHGTSTTPAVTETAPGVYVATPIDFYMAGQWELRTTIAGAVDDMVTPALELQ